MSQKSIRLSLIFVLPVIAALVLTSMVLAHGSLWNPLSRVYGCYLENPESPDSLPCQDLINMGGTQPLYDWNEVNIRDAGANSLAIIPDGHLCSAGRTKYYGLDQARADWPLTVLPAGGTPYTFRWAVTANHQIATFHFYVTKDGYNPNVALKWSDLENFANFDNPTLDTVAGIPQPVYQFTTNLPAKTGRHLIYVLWERHDSIEDFYSCSDVWFGPSAAPTSTPAPACSAPEWVGGGNYNGGAIVSHNGKQWTAKWTNSDEPNTANTSAAWRLEANCTFSGASGAPLATATYLILPTATATSNGPTATACASCGPTNTPMAPTATFTKLPATNTPTRTATAGITATPSRTLTAGPSPTRTRTPTTGPITATPTRTLTPAASATSAAGTCSPATAITAPFTKDGAGTFCWQSTALGTYINSWNTTSVTFNGVNTTNLYIASGSYPAKINGFWYISYNSTSAFGHLEAK